MDEFMDEFMDAMKEVFPKLLIQFEDFSTDNAFKYLSRFREKYRCFNDDVSVNGVGDVLLISHIIWIRSRARVRSFSRVS
jgi:malate dehydrogenase (oxaloacetate-decarboxylating)(NADP+)